MGLSRCGTVGFEKENGVTTIKIEKVMTKFTEKSLHSYPMAFYYSATQSFDGRIAEVESELARFNTMRQEYHRLFVAFDTAYKNSLKSQHTEIIKKKDDERDKFSSISSHFLSTLHASCILFRR